MKPIYAAILAILWMITSMPTFAISNPFAGNANVVIKDGVPCFFVEDARKKLPAESSPSIDLLTDNNSGIDKVWGIDFATGYQFIRSPVSSASCIKLGSTTPTGICHYCSTAPVQRNARIPTLELNRRYWGSFITEAGIYKVDFCLAKDAQGQLYPAKVDGIDCTIEPLNKPSLWERLFGR